METDARPGAIESGGVVASAQRGSPVEIAATKWAGHLGSELKPEEWLRRRTS